MSNAIKGNLVEHGYDNEILLAEGLARAVAEDLNKAINFSDKASLCVPGGTTPALFFNYLSKDDSVEWSKVTIFLNDERCVPNDNDRSNEKLLQQQLLINRASKAQYVSMYGRSENNHTEQLIEQVSELLLPNLPIDVCVLGMGEDGHTASLFPNAAEINEALNVNANTIVKVMHVPEMIIDGVQEKRISLTLPVLLGANRKYLLVKGEAKLDVIAEAMKQENMALPISFILVNSEVNLYYI